MNLQTQFKENLHSVLKKIDTTQDNNILHAADIVAETIENGGFIQAFGSGHSEAAALEVSGRAGGYIQSRSLTELLNFSYLECIEGVGSFFFDMVDIQENDCFILISNSGRNPFHIEFAQKLKENGNKLIVLTNLEVCKDSTSRHSSGLKLIDFADVILDNCGFYGDTSIHIDDWQLDVGPTSSIAAAYVLNLVILQSIENLIGKNIEPPIYKSANIDGGPEFNKILTEKYRSRLLKV